jgi:PAS domain S-box-containing protein
MRDRPLVKGGGMSGTAHRVADSSRTGRGAVSALDVPHLADVGQLGRDLVFGVPGAAALVLDAELRVVAVEGDLDALPGWNAALAGGPISEFLSTGDWRELRSHLAMTLKGAVQQFVHKPGDDESTFRIRMIPIRGPDAVVGVTVLAESIEARRLPLTRDRDLLKATLDSLEASVAILDEHGEIVETNLAWQRFGVANGLGDGASSANYLAVCDEAIDDGSARQVAAGLRAILAGEQDEFTQDYACHSPTEQRWFILRATRSAGTGPPRVVVTHMDVTARRLAQDQVRALRDRTIVARDGQSNGTIGDCAEMTEPVAAQNALLAERPYYSAVIDGMSEGMLSVDHGGRLTYMNPAAERILGWSLTEVHGRLWHAIMPSRREDGSTVLVQESPVLGVCRDGMTVSVDDHFFTHRDGSVFPVAYTASPLQTDDDNGCAVVFTDVSERRARDQALQRDADKLGWIDRIQDALAEERFVLYSQPIIDVRTHQTVQQELLLRLRNPDGSITAPGAYLNIAEEYGLIGEIDRWVIEQGAQIASRGNPVEINVSACSVGDRSLLDHIDRCLRSTGVDPALLVFEITETAIVEDAAAARVFAERLHELGCKLALDDFGTGYGTFTLLKQIPVDYLKIDIEFVRDLTSNVASHHVVEAVVGLAHVFNLQTVAEGVEDAETLTLLRELGVDFAQGFYIARPGPLPEVPVPIVACAA